MKNLHSLINYMYLCKWLYKIFINLPYLIYKVLIINIYNFTLYENQSYTFFDDAVMSFRVIVDLGSM